jgi:very-short-patch-repair endonuclease
MKILIIALALLVVIAIIFAKFKQRSSLGDGEVAWPFYAKKPLTQPEQVLYHRLVSALPEHIVLAQVQLSRILGVKQGNNFHEWNNRINRMSLDFVVCGKDASVIAAIELDDKSHEKASRKEADDKKDKALASAGVRLVRWQVNALPDETAILLALKTPHA